MKGWDIIVDQDQSRSCRGTKLIRYQRRRNPKDVVCRTTPCRSCLRLTCPDSAEILLPVEPPRGLRYPDLGFVPLALRPLSLVLLMFACLLMVAGLIFSNVHSLQSTGLWDYNGLGTARYFVFQFLPQMLGMFLVLWLFVVQAALYRTIPFFCMSSQRPADRALQALSLLPENFVLPDLLYFRSGQPLVGTVLFVIWLSYFTVPLLACSYQTELFGIDGQLTWRWTSVQGISWTVVALYLMLALALFLLLVRLASSTSALMWDPVSLADLIPLFRRSNILSNFARTEVSEEPEMVLAPKMLRLGYWTTSRHSGMFHGIGEENAPVGHGEEGKVSKDLEKGHNHFDSEAQRSLGAESFMRNILSPSIRYRWTPWPLRDSAVVAWPVIAILLLIAFIVVSFVNHGVSHGFMPLLPTRTNSAGFSSSNFLYSFLPSILGMFLFLAWQPLDTYFRAVQPFANLTRPTGATAERSLLLAYPSCYPIEITVAAILNHDFKLAWISFVSLISLAIPVLSGGIFAAQFFESDNQVRIVASMPAYYALVVFLAIYAFSFLCIWPGRKRYLPHKISTLADIMSFLYQSPLLTDTAFRDVRTKADLVARLLVADHKFDGEADGRSPKYAFGIYLGRDGMEHLGIDRLQRPGSGEMLATTGIRP